MYFSFVEFPPSPPLIRIISQGGNEIGDVGLRAIADAIRRAAIVVTTSTWCSLDTWITGNEESHTLHPFKERVCGFKLPGKKGSLNHNCRFPNRIAEETHDIPSSVAHLALHVKYFIVITPFPLLHPHHHCLRYRNQAASNHTNGPLPFRMVSPRTPLPFVNLPVPWRRGKKKPPR